MNIFQKLKENIQDYQNLPDETISFEQLTGWTNKVYKVSAPSKEPLIFREFGSVPLVSEQLERRNFQMLSDANLGPKLLAQGEGFRVEQFLPGESLSRKEMGAYATQVGSVLSHFHQVQTGTGKPATQTFIENWSELFLKQSQTYELGENSPKLEELKILTDPEAHKGVFSLLPKSDLVFSHNDFSYRNILKTYNGLVIIDFEYADLSFPGIDLANYIVDSMFDYSRSVYEYFPEDQLSPSEESELVGTYAQESNLNEEDLTNQVQACKAAVNFMGALWAACNFTPPNYEYLEYSKVRLDLYNFYASRL